METPHKLSSEDRFWINEWKKLMESGEAKCRACGDRATRMKVRGKMPGCYCGCCYNEVTRGSMPDVTNPKRWKNIKYGGGA